MRKIDELPDNKSKVQYLSGIIEKLKIEAEEILQRKGDQEKHLDLQRQIREAQTTKNYYQN